MIIQNPVITAIVPCFNHENFLSEALFSLSTQNYPLLRIMFVDDASTDNSWTVAKNLCQNLRPMGNLVEGEPAELLGGKFENLDIILARFSKNYGPSVSRNYGIKCAWDGTDIFAFLDADDQYLSNKINRSIVPFLKYGPFAGIVYSDYETYNQQTQLICRVFAEGYSREKLLGSCIINMDSLISKNAFEAGGLFDEEMRVAEDWDSHVRLSEKLMCFHIPESLVRIRVNNPLNTTNRYDSSYWQKCRQRIFDKMQTRLIPV